MDNPITTRRRNGAQSTNRPTSKSQARPAPRPGCACCARGGFGLRKPLVGKYQPSGRDLVTKHTNYHCGHAGCEYCHNARYLELKFWRRRYDQQPGLVDRARADLVEELTAAGCTSWLEFRQVDCRTRSSLLHALQRSKRSPRYGFVELANGSLGMAVEPGWEEFVRERIGRQEDEHGRVGVFSLGALLDAAPIRQIGGSVRPVAIKGNSSKKIATTRTPASLHPSTFVHDLTHVPANTPEEHAKIGLDYPDTLQRAKLLATQLQTGSTIDDGAIPMVPSEKETVPMMTRDEAKEFLELQRAILREQMEQTELLRKQVDRTRDDTDPHHAPAKRRLQ